MKNTRKAIALLLALTLLAFAFAGCSSNAAATATPAPTAAPTAEATAAPTTAPVASPVATDSGSTAENEIVAYVKSFATEGDVTTLTIQWAEFVPGEDESDYQVNEMDEPESFALSKTVNATLPVVAEDGTVADLADIQATDYEGVIKFLTAFAAGYAGESPLCRISIVENQVADMEYFYLQ